MSDPELKKQIEQMRGTPFPTPKPPKIDPKIKKDIEKLRGTPVPSPTVKEIKQGVPIEIKNYDDVKIVEYHLNKSLYTTKQNLDKQLKAISAQQQAIKDAEAKHQKIVSKRVGETLTAKSQRAYKKYLEEHVEYLKKTKGNLSLSKKNVDKINKAIKDIEEQLGIVSTFRAKKGKVVEGAKKYKVTYVEDGKSKSKTFDTYDKAEKFFEEITTPQPGPIQVLMRSRIIKQTDLIDGKVYYALDKPVDELTSGQRRLLEQAGFTLPLPGKKESERYRNQIESTTNWLANQIYSDLVDKEEAEKVIKELEPVFLSTVTYGPDPAKEMIKKIDLRLAELEKKAKYKEYEGYTLFGQKQYPPEVVKARVAHLSLSAIVGAGKSAPFIALGTAGGPIISGLLAASMIATIANPQNQALLRQYVKEHPQQFIAELSGALALGYGVGQVKTLYNKYKNDIPDAYTQQFEMQLATDVPDFASVRTEELHPWFEETVYTKFLKGLSAEDAQKFLKSSEATLYFGAGDEFGRPMSIYDLIQVHPELDKPFAIYLPNVKRLVPKYADLITKVPGEKGMYVMPSAVAAMAIIAQQGYITEEDIQNLIKSIEVQNANLNINTDELEVTWTDEDLGKLTIPDIIPIVDSLPDMTTTPIIEPITEPIVEPVLELPLIEIPIKEVPTEIPPESKRTGLPKFSEKEIRKFRIQLFKGPKSKYKVEFHYRRNSKQSVTVEARSYPEALSKAQRVRRVTRELPTSVDMRRVK